MMTALRQWLASIPLTDPVERRQASVFQMVLIGWIALTSLWVPLTLIGFFVAPPPAQMPAGPVPFIFMVVMWMSIVASLLLWAVPIAALAVLRRGRFKLSVSIATLGLLLAHSMATYFLGTTSGAVLVVFQIPIALAGLLAGRRLLLTVAGWSILLVLLIAYLESLSPPLAGLFALVPGPDGQLVNPSATSMGINLPFFIGITILLTILLDRFGSALRDALNSSLDREEELRGIRASLESTVAERTAELQAALGETQTRAEEQARLLAEIEQQRVMIKDLSVPVIPISTKTLVMPLVGALDSTRLRHLQEQSLQALQRSTARTLVLDITGVPVVDSQVAQGLLMTVRSARLLGADVILVGIRPEVAQTLVGLGIELRDIATFSDLQSALARIPSETARNGHQAQRVEGAATRHEK
jgi:anti-anti-sigma regulatory factor